MQIYCTRLYFKIVFWHVFFLNLAGRGLGRCHRSVALGALELGGVFLQRRLRGPGAPDGRVLRLGERLSVSFRFWTQVFVQVRRFMKIFRRFCKDSAMFAWLLHCAGFVSCKGPASNGQYLSCLRQARSSIICLWDCNQLQIGGRNDHKKSVSRFRFSFFCFPFVFEFSFSKTVKSYILGGLGQRDYYLKPAFLISFEIHFLDKTKTLHAQKARKLRTTRGDWRHKLCRRKVSRSLEFEVPSLWVLWSYSFQDVFLDSVFFKEGTFAEKVPSPTVTGKITASRFLQIHLLLHVTLHTSREGFHTSRIYSCKDWWHHPSMVTWLDMLESDWFYQCCANVEQFCGEHVARTVSSQTTNLCQCHQCDKGIRFLECFSPLTADEVHNGFRTK